MGEVEKHGGVRVGLEQRGGEADGADLAVVEELVGGGHGRSRGRREPRGEVEVEVEDAGNGGVLPPAAAGGAGRRAEEEVGRVRVPVPVAGRAGRRADEGRGAGAVVAGDRRLVRRAAGCRGHHIAGVVVVEVGWCQCLGGGAGGMGGKGGGKWEMGGWWENGKRGRAWRWEFLTRGAVSQISPPRFS